MNCGRVDRQPGRGIERFTVVRLSFVFLSIWRPQRMGTSSRARDGARLPKHRGNLIALDLPLGSCTG